MLSTQENEILTRVGPGTPMGKLMREYWIPCMRSDELPGPDSAPVRVMLLCEKLIAFRDSNGQIALIEEACPHRGASLFFGHNKDCGLRCAFHGWKFDVTGQCVDVPADLSQNFKKKIKAKTYPCRERGGVVWTYMGPRETPPPLPDLAANDDRPEYKTNFAFCEGNWLQYLEMDLDFHHLHLLHKGVFAYAKKHYSFLPTVIEWLDRSSSHRLEVADSEVGCTFGVSEEINAAGDRCWGIGQFMFPFYALLPQSELGNYWTMARVPVDDEHTMTIRMHPGNPQTSPESLLGSDPYLPNDSSWYGRHRLTRNPRNDFLINRELQNNTDSVLSYSGLQGLDTQDIAIASSMGPIADRTKEHLTPDDLMTVRVRKRLLRAVDALTQQQQTPPGVDHPAAYKVKHGSLTLPKETDWFAALQNKDTENDG